MTSERPADRIPIEVGVAVIADVLDSHGMRSQCLGWDIVPIGGATRLVGRAFTVGIAKPTSPPKPRYEGLLAALDALGPGDVWTMATERSNDVAVWGELVSTAALATGAVGMVTDGLVRDIDKVRDLRFPVHARGTIPLDIDGRFEVVGLGDTVVIDQVPINQGDLIVGDNDGVVVVPRSVEAAVIEAAVQKVEAENLFRAAVASGETPSVAYEQYGVL